jgi:ribosomal protein S18 acetylase RimI-like enzyme
MSRTVRIELLAGEHNRAQFSSGSETLDRYLRTQASQDFKRRTATCFVALDNSTSEIVGYYTLTATSLALDALPPRLVKKLPCYPVVPAVLLGRLAVALTHQGQGWGGVLLADALKRVGRAEVGVFAMVVDAKDEPAQRFYERYGFALLPGENRRLFLPIGEALRRLASR